MNLAILVIEYYINYCFKFVGFKFY